jgi:hypothetical protein
MTTIKVASSQNRDAEHKRGPEAAAKIRHHVGMMAMVIPFTAGMTVVFHFMSP